MKIKGFPVLDARRPLVVRITRRDITGSDVKNPSSCAAARACLRQVEGCSEVRVHLSRTYVRIADKWHRYATSHAIRGEIIAFDRGGSFEPGDYMLSRPTKATPGRQQGSRTSQTRSKKLHRRRAPPHVVAGVRPMHPRGRA